MLDYILQNDVVISPFIIYRAYRNNDAISIQNEGVGNEARFVIHHFSACRRKHSLPAPFSRVVGGISRIIERNGKSFVMRPHPPGIKGVIHVQENELDFTRFHFGVEFLYGGYFPNTWSAPRSPKIQKNDLTPSVRNLMCLSSVIPEHQIWKPFALVPTNIS